MTTAWLRIGSLFLFSGALLGPASRSVEAQTLVTVSFSGTETTGTPPRPFNGSFTYDQSAPVSTTAGRFVFSGSVYYHQLSYTINSGTPVVGTGTSCDPFTITTSGGSKKNVQLTATLSGNTVTITLPTNSTLDQRHLPFSGTYPSPPLTGSTFKVTGSTTFNGTISTLSAEEALVSATEPTSSPQHPTVGWHVPVGESPAAYWGYTSCEPRPGCGLSRLFARRSHRICGR